MPGYLDQYGVEDAKRERFKFLLVGSVLGTALLGTILYFTFRDFRLERQIKDFLAALQRQDYKSAYTYWGCSAEVPCRAYPFERFMEDWGPNTSNARLAKGSVGTSERCGTGYIASVGSEKEAVTLWVERETLVVGFAPWQECPEKKLRLMKWLKMKFGNG